MAFLIEELDRIWNGDGWRFSVESSQKTLVPVGKCKRFSEAFRHMYLFGLQERGKSISIVIHNSMQGKFVFCELLVE